MDYFFEVSIVGEWFLVSDKLAELNCWMADFCFGDIGRAWWMPWRSSAAPFRFWSSPTRGKAILFTTTGGSLFFFFFVAVLIGLTTATASGRMYRSLKNWTNFDLETKILTNFFTLRLQFDLKNQNFDNFFYLETEIWLEKSKFWLFFYLEAEIWLKKSKFWQFFLPRRLKFD